MQPNPVLKKLGFSEKDRLVIIHTDDIGMCQASVAAFADLWEFGLISSGSVMVPCPWALQAAAYARAHPQVDLGVHTTLTSEWQTYRWGPISTRDPASGLMDEQGYFYRTSADVQAHAGADVVQHELEAQVAWALREGIPVTHVDTHMGAVVDPKFVAAYIQLGVANQVPVMMYRLDDAGFMKLGMDATMAAQAAQMVFQLEGMGMPLLDSMSGMSLDTPDDRMRQAQQAFSQLQPGITHFVIHPSKETPELRAITPDWPSRAADYATFMKEELRQYIHSIGVQVIGYHHLKELIGK